MCSQAHCACSAMYVFSFQSCGRQPPLSQIAYSVCEMTVQLTVLLTHTRRKHQLPLSPAVLFYSFTILLRVCTRTHARTRARTHARTHTHTLKRNHFEHTKSTIFINGRRDLKTYTLLWPLTHAFTKIALWWAAAKVLDFWWCLCHSPRLSGWKGIHIPYLSKSINSAM